nr:transglutaminase domain-containing protein [uncultured Acetatifactor sp.]
MQRKSGKSNSKRRAGSRWLLPVLFAACGWLYIDGLAYKTLHVEAGVEVSASDFMKNNDDKAVFLPDSQDFDTTVPGEYEVKVKCGLFTHKCRLIVEDTVAPVAETVEVRRAPGKAFWAEAFVSNITDATRVTVSYVTEPDFTQTGEQTIQVILTDRGGNWTVLEAELYLAEEYAQQGSAWQGDADGEDAAAPVIHGAADLEFFIGDSISYRKNVTAIDDRDGEVELEVDTSGVDLTREGVYPVTYTAKDGAGNCSSVTVNLTVKSRQYSQEEVDACADAALAQIIDPGMSLQDKAWAIYSYVKNHIAYINHSEKGDPLRAAYEGLAEGKGDCYVYACTAKVLLTRAGIPNVDIQRRPAEVEHYWNLVDVGEGWLHFDTTPRTDNPEIYLWTDQELMEYSKEHDNAFDYDPALYPEIN